MAIVARGEKGNSAGEFAGGAAELATQATLGQNGGHAVHTFLLQICQWTNALP